jgi:hypothetical protein
MTIDTTSAALARTDRPVAPTVLRVSLSGGRVLDRREDAVMTALARTRAATAMTFRDQLRRPLVLALIVVIPAYVITRSIAETLATPRRVGLPDGVYVTTTMKALHGAGMGGVVVAFVAALLGVFVRKRRSSTRSRLPRPRRRGLCRT